MGGTVEAMSKLALCVLLVCNMLPAALSSKAWSEFLAAEKATAGSRKLLGDGIGRYTTGLKSVQVQPLSPAVGNEALTVTVNKFITNGTTLSSQADIKANIWKLCQKGAPGTSFSQVAAEGYSSTIADPMCYYCLSRGYGVDEDTPGFYLPCGCQRTCVDVSGNTQGSFSSVQTSASASYFGPTSSLNGKAAGGFPFLSNSVANQGLYGNGKGTYGQAMTTCQDYIDNKLVTTCNDMFIYHFVLWPSVMGGVALLYAAYSIATMPLDMDSLLYTVGSSGKKEA